MSCYEYAGIAATGDRLEVCSTSLATPTQRWKYYTLEHVFYMYHGADNKDAYVFLNAWLNTIKT